MPEGTAAIREIATRNLREIDVYHYRRFLQTFRAAGFRRNEVRTRIPFSRGWRQRNEGVNLGAIVADDPEIRAFMTQKIEDNVSLIVTIPRRAHEGLALRLQGLLSSDALDQRLLMQALRREYGSTGYNLRRLTRDQTNKTIGGLSKIRQTKAGIDSYRWLTAGDERVRASHAALDEDVFRWDSPPSIGHPGDPIQCRCVPQPVIDSLF